MHANHTMLNGAVCPCDCPVRDTDTIPGKALTLYRRHDTPTLPILNAVNALWREIQANNPGTPNVSIVLQQSERAHGHFAPGAWATREGARMHEVMLSTVSLAYTTNSSAVVKTVSTLLHEAAHAWAHENGVKDTSRQGRWHNKEFARIAERFGCEVTADPSIGHRTEGISNDARALYAPQIDALTSAVTVFRSSPQFDLSALLGGFLNPTGASPFAPKPRARYGSQSVTVICECPGTQHRVPRALYESSTITCDTCESTYTEMH